MGAQVIGESLGRGYKGTYSRENAYRVISVIAAETIEVGQAVKYDANGKLVAMGAGSKAAEFLGVVVRAVKQAVSIDQTVASYAPGDVVPVMTIGNVVVQVVGASTRNGSAYVRVAGTGTVGGFEAAADATETNTVLLTNARFNGAPDADGLAELSILYPINA